MYQPARCLYWFPESFHVAARASLTVALHEGDSFPDSQSAPAVAEAHALMASGDAPVSALHPRGVLTLGRITLPGAGYAILSAWTPPSRSRLTSFAKAILVAGQPDIFYRHPAGLAFEITPRTDPAQAHSGDSLMIDLVLHNAPAAGVQIEISSVTTEGPHTKIAGLTDRAGRIAIPIEGTGRYRLRAAHATYQTTLVLSL